MQGKTVLLLTSLALSLLSKKENPPGNALCLPSFPGMVEVKSAIPGRIRFRLPTLIGNDQVCAQLQEQYKQLSVIKGAAANPRTGSLLLYYEETAVAPQVLEGALIRFLGLEEKLNTRPLCLVEREVTTFAAALNQAVLAKTKGIIDGRWLVALTLAGISLGQIMIRKTATPPNSYSLLWWAGNIMRRKGQG